MDKETIILGVIGADCHAVGNKILDIFFSKEGFNIVNLGVMVMQDEFIDAAIETKAKAILVSSLYGHGEIDCAGLRERCIERGLRSIILYCGGNLVVGKKDLKETERLFLEMGYDRIFDSQVDLNEVSVLLKKDIGERYGDY